MSFKKKLTPAMGWASWNALGHNIGTDILISQMDALVETGLVDAGYTYFNIDDTFQNGRDKTTGRLKINTEKFPQGANDMKRLADRAHSMGLKAGIYSDGGANSCASGNFREWGLDVGLYRHERDDLYMYLGDGNYKDTFAVNNPKDDGIECWGYDFIKVDWCGGANNNLNPELQYTKIGDIIEEIEHRFQKDKIYNICCWSYKGPWQLKADSWRTSTDIDMRGGSFASVLSQVNVIKGLSGLTGPGHINDPDMMIVGKGLTPIEDETHFAYWCMFSAPLMIGCDLTTIRKETVKLLTNKELIAINQDPACLSASYLGTIGQNVEVWVKPLGSADSDTKAIMFVNLSDVKQNIKYNFSQLGYNEKVNIRNLIKHMDIEASREITSALEPHQCVVYKISPTVIKPSVAIKAKVSGIRELPCFNGIEGKDYKYPNCATRQTDQIKITDKYDDTYISVPSSSYETAALIYFEKNGNNPAQFEINLGGKVVYKTINTTGLSLLTVNHCSSPDSGELNIICKNAKVMAVSVCSSLTANGKSELADIADATINLTELGNCDWCFYGKTGKNTVIKKQNGNSKIDITATGGKEIQTNGKINYLWCDGDKQERGINISGGQRLYGKNEYYTITLPASPLEHNVYLPLQVFSANIKIELIIGDIIADTAYINCAADTTVYKMYKAAYSASGCNNAAIKITLTDTYTLSGAVTLGGLALSTQEHRPTKYSINTHIANFEPTSANVDWVKFGENGSRKSGQEILSDYTVALGTAIISTTEGDALREYGTEFEFVLPQVESPMRADIAFALKFATALVSVYSDNEIHNELITDVNGNSNALLSIWYNVNSPTSVRLKLYGVSHDNAELILKSISLTSAASIVTCPQISESNGKLSATFETDFCNGDAQFIYELYNDNGSLIKTEISRIESSEKLQKVTKEITLPGGFTKGLIETHIVTSDGAPLGFASAYNYPLTACNITPDEENKIGGLTAKALLKNGAILLDVRTPEEFAESHLEGAINIPHTQILTDVPKLDGVTKNSVFVCYCSAAKRSAQAVITLNSMGYCSYNLGDMRRFSSADSGIRLSDPSLGTWSENDIIYIDTTEASRFDNVSLYYSIGADSTFSDAVPYDELTGIKIEDCDCSAYTVKAYLYLEYFGMVINEITQKYPITLSAPRLSHIAYPIEKMNFETTASCQLCSVELNGANFNNGIKILSQKEGENYIITDIPCDAKYFTAVVGAESGETNITVKIYIDGRLCETSPILSGSNSFVFKTALPINAKKLKISTNGRDVCIIANAGFMRDKSTYIPVEADYKINKYLSDIIDTSIVSKDKDAMLLPLTIGDNIFRKGIGVIAGKANNKKVITCEIPENSVKFIAVAGNTKNEQNGNPTAFSVYVDNILRDCCTLSNDEYYTFNIKLTDTDSELKLVAESQVSDENHCGWGAAFFAAPRDIYVSDSGSDSNDGLTTDSPKQTIKSALHSLKIGGKIIVTDKYTVFDTSGVANTKSTVSITGLTADSEIIFYRMPLQCNLVLSNITVKRGERHQTPINANGHNITIGDNVIFDTEYTAQDGTLKQRDFFLAQHDYVPVDGFNSVISINSGNLAAVFAGDNYGIATGNAKIIIDGTASIGNLALLHNCNPKSEFSGTAEIYINGGTVENLIFGADVKGGTKGTFYAQINGGKVGKIKLSSTTSGTYLADFTHEVIEQLGIHILEINGGEITDKTVTLGELVPAATRVIIFNNGMADGITVADKDAIIINSLSNKGYVRAITNDANQLEGITVETLCAGITVNGTKHTEYTLNASERHIFTLTPPEKGTVLQVDYN